MPRRGLSLSICVENAMIIFRAAPSVPSSYSLLLSALGPTELAEAQRVGYVAEHANPSNSVNNSKAFNVDAEIGAGLADWRNRMFLVWFCYVFENLAIIQKPLAGIEELILEFQGGPLDFDAPLPRLASVYAGAASWEPLSPAELARQRTLLEPYYRNAVSLLRGYKRPKASFE